MVKRVHLVFDDSDFEKLKELKGDKSWEKFILENILGSSPTDKERE